MVIRGVLRFFAFALLAFALAAAGSEGKSKPDELLLDNQLYSALMEINDDLAEIFWVHCGVELTNTKEAVENGEYSPGKKSGSNDALTSRSRLSGKDDLPRAASVLHPELKQTLLDCLRKKNVLFLVSGEESGSSNWFTKHLGFLFSKTEASKRRYLLESSAPAPGPSPATTSPVIAPASPPPSISSNSPVSNPHRPSQSPVEPFFPTNFSDSDLQPTAGGQSSATPDSSSSRHKTVLVAVVSTATVTSVFAALLFFCCYRFCRNRSGVGWNDEKPLLSLSLSEYSAGSSHNPFAVGNSTNNGKLGNESFNSSLSDNKTGSSLDGSIYCEPDILITSKAGTQALSRPPGLPPLKPPPGREYLSPTGQPPLKLPSGMATPPPPPPPPGKASPPLPPPPIPPPSLKPTGPPPSLKPTGPPPPPPPIPSDIKTGPRPPPPGPPPPPVPSGIKTGPRPPPPPIGSAPPRPPSLGLKPPRSSGLAPNHPSKTAGDGSEADGSKPKLKPFFWDKVLANPDHSMVWHQIKSGSFQFNEEMIETLFGYAPPEKNNLPNKGSSSKDPATQYIQIIDSKKAQNLSILLRALNVTTEEVCDALQEGNELPLEFLQTLLKMAPTSEEELKLRAFSGEISKLGPADRFLKFLVDIPFAFKRIEYLLFMCTLHEEVSMMKESFTILEAACTELRKSRLFLKLLEAVLKTGNRMNDGTFRGGAQAFKLDTLLKLSDVKGTDGKITLLHFVVQEIIRSEGVRAARALKESRSISSIKSDVLVEDSLDNTEEYYRNLGLEVVSGLSNELENVKKAAVLDADGITGTVAKLGHQLIKARDFLNKEMKNVDEENGFHQALKSFVQNAEVDITSLLEEEKRIMALVKSTGDYFHGNARKDEGLRLFIIVRDFLIMLDKTCKEVKDAPRKVNRTPGRETSTVKPSSEPKKSPDPRQLLFPAIKDRRMDDFSSDDDSP